MNKILILGALAAMSGCAFQQPQTLDDARFKLTADWVSETASLPREQVKSSRDLIRIGSARFEARGYITVPVTAPEWLTLGVAIPQEALSVSPSFARAFVNIESKTYELPVRIANADSKEGVSILGLQLGGLRALIPTHYSARTTIRVEVFSDSNRLVSVDFKVRTPPSQVEKETGGLKDARGKAKPGETGLIRSRVSGVQFNLIREFTFQNAEDAPVEIQIPRRIQGVLRQWTNPMTYRNLGCPGAGYSYEQKPHHAVLGGRLLLLPMDDGWVVEAERAVRRPDDLDPILREVRPRGIVRIGLYAIGEGADQWSERGPFQADVKTVKVPGSCVFECPLFMPRAIRDPDWPDRCFRRWEQREISLAVGVDRGPVELDFPAGAPAVRYRFADFEANQDSEIREHKLTEDRSVVPWSE